LRAFAEDFGDGLGCFSREDSIAYEAWHVSRGSGVHTPKGPTSARARPILMFTEP
jgi:hypothetical protein